MQLRRPTPPPPHKKIMTTPSSCPAHKKNATKRERTRTVWPTDPYPKSMHATSPTTPLPPPPLSFTKIFIYAKHKDMNTFSQTHPPTPTNLPPTTYPGSPPPDARSSYTKFTDSSTNAIVATVAASKGSATTSALTTSLTSAHRTKFTSKVHTPVNTSALHSACSSH